MTYLAAGAAFSGPDRAHRWLLWRTWGSAPAMLVIGLNPSKADECDDDPTIRRCVGFARREGCGRLVMANIVPFRATAPANMVAWLTRTPVEVVAEVMAQNVTAILQAAQDDCRHVVAAWGALDRFALVMSLRHLARTTEAALNGVGKDIGCLGRTKAGDPRHPLYLRRDAQLLPWTP